MDAQQWRVGYCGSCYRPASLLINGQCQLCYGKVTGYYFYHIDDGRHSIGVTWEQQA